MSLTLPDATVAVPGYRFRPWSDRDVPDIVAAWQDPEMHRWMPEEVDPVDVEEAGKFVESAARNQAEGTSLALAIAEADRDRAVGSMMFTVWAPGHWNVGYWVAPEYRGRGLATGALSVLARWAFRAHPELQRLSLYTLPGNAASQRVATAAGFQREGLLRRWAEIGGRRHDWLMFSLIRDDLSPQAAGSGRTSRTS